MRSSKRQVLFNKPDSALRLSGANKSITGGTLVEGCTSSRTYIDTDGILKTALANVPVWENGGLRHEGASINLLLQSSDISSASWTKTRTGYASNAAVDPSGASLADKEVDDSTAANTHIIRQTVTIAPSTKYTLSSFGKKGERANQTIYFQDASVATDRVELTADLNSGTVGNVVASGNYSAPTGGVIALANSWFRNILSGITKAVSTSAEARIYLHNGASITYNGDNSSGIYVFGSQLEAGDVSSYIPTTTAAVPRATCSLSVPLVLNQNFFQKSAIVMRVRAKWANSATAKSWLTPSTTAEGLIDNGSGALTFKDSAGNTATADLTSWAADTIVQVAIVTDNVAGLMSLSASKDNGVTWIDSSDTVFAGLTVGANWLLFSANTQVFECLGWNVIKPNKGFAQMKAYAKANALRLTQ
jgi:hypothetical protein